jgi:hypothetical protein
MRAGLWLTGLGGLITAAAAAGHDTLIGVGAVALLVIAVLCWTVSKRSRTRNMVSIISALRRSGPRNPPGRRGPPRGRR